MRIAGREVGPGRPVYVVAELSANHRGSLERAREIVRAAARAGADAVKLQTYGPDDITMDSDAPAFRVAEVDSLWTGRTLYDLYREGATPMEWHKPLFEEARRAGLAAFSTPFSPSAVPDLENLGVPAYKVASLENNHVPLLRAIAATGKPVILSTGTSTVEEVDFGVKVLREANCGPLAVLQCISSYPTAPENVHLRAMESWAARYGCVGGLSDHTLGIAVPTAAAALGAAVVEKHLTLDRDDGALDSRFSLTPVEFADMVAGIRAASAARGTGSLAFANDQRENRRYRRSIFVTRAVRSGDVVSPDNVALLRPGGGLAAARWDGVQGRSFRRAVAKGEPLSDDMLA